MEGNNDLHRRAEDLSVPSFLRQETPGLSVFPITRNREHGEYWFQSRDRDSVRTREIVPVRNIPQNHHLGPDVFYSYDDMHRNLAPRANSAIYSPPVSSRNNLVNFRPQASWDPFCPGGESFWSMDYHGARSFPDDFSLEAEFGRLQLLDDDYNQTSLSRYSSLNRLHENEQPPQFSYGDLQPLRARAAANGFMRDTYNINNPRDGFNFRNSNISWIPSPPNLHGVVSEAMDQHGCRSLCQRLHEGKPEDIQMILSEVKDHIYRLLHDRFGNNVIQKLFEVCDQQQMSQLVSAVTAHGHLLMSVCLHPQGSQSIQKLVQCLMEPEQISRMISIFRHITVPLVNNQIGSRVIQRCLSIFPAEETKEILNVIADHCVQIATNQSGCCLLQIFITKDSPLESQWRIVTEIVLNINELSKHQFGNYVVQYVIGLEIPNVMEGMLAGLKGNFVSLSMDKYGSNVVEKLMRACQKKFAPQIINELITNSLDFLNVVLDPYGNYVVQSAKTCATGGSRRTLNKLILEHSNELRSHPYGKNVLLNKEKTRHSI
ncbi:pumilio homolog 12-like [Henckelia pumila]|uniref:pumilio homolog 12-like n=1 Tax=Henckelia pumila TaxID=405737 RepID=UPI003C6E232D